MFIEYKPTNKTWSPIEASNYNFTTVYNKNAKDEEVFKIENLEDVKCIINTLILK